MNAADFEKSYEREGVAITVKRVSENTLKINDEEISIDEFESLLHKGEITEVIEPEEEETPEPSPAPEPIEPVSAPAPVGGSKPYRSYTVDELKDARENWRGILRTDKTDTAQDTANAQMDVIETELKTR